MLIRDFISEAYWKIFVARGEKKGVCLLGLGMGHCAVPVWLKSLILCNCVLFGPVLPSETLKENGVRLSLQHLLIFHEECCVQNNPIELYHKLSDNFSLAPNELLSNWLAISSHVDVAWDSHSSTLAFELKLNSCAFLCNWQLLAVTVVHSWNILMCYSLHPGSRAQALQCLVWETPNQSVTGFLFWKQSMVYSRCTVHWMQQQINTAKVSTQE